MAVEFVRVINPPRCLFDIGRTDVWLAGSCDDSERGTRESEVLDRLAGADIYHTTARAIEPCNDRRSAVCRGPKTVPGHRALQEVLARFVVTMTQLYILYSLDKMEIWKEYP